MSLADARARTRMKMALLAECNPSRVLAVADHGDDATPGDRIRGAAAGLFGGRLACSAIQLYELQAPGGALHLYAQPFDGWYPMPGEHHAWVPGAVPTPACYVDGFAGGAWEVPDATFKGWLKGQPFSREVLGAGWKWAIGASVAKRDWLLQLRPLAGGTHIAMAATGCHAQTSPEVGFALLARVAEQVSAAIAAQPPGPIQEAPFLKPTVFGALYEAVMRGDHLPVLPEANVAGRDLGLAIHQLFAGRSGAGLHAHPVPPDKERNVRQHVLPPEARGLPIVALLDLTLMGSAKEAVVFTPTHGFVHHDGGRLFFAWSEVRFVRAPSPGDDAIVLRLAARGEVALPCGRHAEAIHQLAAELAAIPG